MDDIWFKKLFINEAKPALTRTEITSEVGDLTYRIQVSESGEVIAKPCRCLVCGGTTFHDNVKKCVTCYPDADKTVVCSECGTALDGDYCPTCDTSCCPVCGSQQYIKDPDMISCMDCHYSVHLCEGCGNPVDECTCNDGEEEETCPECGEPVDACTCNDGEDAEPCPVCGTALEEAGYCPDCGVNYCVVCCNPVDECTCEEEEDL